MIVLQLTQNDNDRLDRFPAIFLLRAYHCTHYINRARRPRAVRKRRVENYDGHDYPHPHADRAASSKEILASMEVGNSVG